MTLAMIRLTTTMPAKTPTAIKAVDVMEGPYFGVMTEVTVYGEEERGRAFGRKPKEWDKMSSTVETPPWELGIRLVPVGIRCPSKGQQFYQGQLFRTIISSWKNFLIAR